MIVNKKGERYINEFAHAGAHTITVAAMDDAGNSVFRQITIVVDTISAFHIGVLIALFERAVGLYAAMVGINAYHQPGVEAGKRAAGELIELQKGFVSFLGKNRNRSFSSAEIAREMGAESEAENIYKIGQHLAANPERGVEMIQADSPAEVRFSMK